MSERQLTERLKGNTPKATGHCRNSSLVGVVQHRQRPDTLDGLNYLRLSTTIQQQIMQGDSEIQSSMHELWGQ